MESSSVSGEREEEEECGSSQSGWTMYIDTPTYQDDAGNDSDCSKVVVDDNEEVSIHDDEDDSLASDASSTWCERRNAENTKVDDEDEDAHNEDDNDSCGLHHPRPSRNVVQKEIKVSRNV